MKWVLVIPAGNQSFPDKWSLKEGSKSHIILIVLFLTCLTLLYLTFHIYSLIDSFTVFSSTIISKFSLDYNNLMSIYTNFTGKVPKKSKLLFLKITVSLRILHTSTTALL